MLPLIFVNNIISQTLWLPLNIFGINFKQINRWSLRKQTSNRVLNTAVVHLSFCKMLNYMMKGGVLLLYTLPVAWFHVMKQVFQWEKRPYVVVKNVGLFFLRYLIKYVVCLATIRKWLETHLSLQDVSSSIAFVLYVLENNIWNTSLQFYM